MTAWTPAHSEHETLTYRFDVTRAKALAAVMMLALRVVADRIGLGELEPGPVTVDVASGPVA